MPTREANERRDADDRVEARPAFGREWWGFDRDGLEDELARRETARAAGPSGEVRPH